MPQQHNSGKNTFKLRIYKQFPTIFIHHRSHQRTTKKATFHDCYLYLYNVNTVQFEVTDNGIVGIPVDSHPLLLIESPYWN